MARIQHCKKAMEFFIKFGWLSIFVDHKLFLDTGSKAFLSYKELPNKVLDFEHTVTPKEQQGKGIAKLLVQEGLRYAGENGYQVKPTCWYVLFNTKRLFSITFDYM